MYNENTRFYNFYFREYTHFMKIQPGDPGQVKYIEKNRKKNQKSILDFRKKLQYFLKKENRKGILKKFFFKENRVISEEEPRC